MVALTLFFCHRCSVNQQQDNIAFVVNSQGVSGSSCGLVSDVCCILGSN